MKKSEERKEKYSISFIISFTEKYIGRTQVYIETAGAMLRNPFFRKGVVDSKTGKGIGPEMKI